MQAFEKEFSPDRLLLVGEGGLGLEAFLAAPASSWVADWTILARLGAGAGAPGAAGARRCLSSGKNRVIWRGLGAGAGAPGGFTIVTSDEVFAAYGIPLIRA